MQDKRLLICGDLPAFGRFVKNVAKDLGYAVRVTTEGHAFVNTAGFQPTTIVLDMIMPGMWLAKERCTARVIIITGYTPDYATHAKILGDSDR